MLAILLINDAPPPEDADLVLHSVDEVCDEGEYDEQHDDDDRDGDVFLHHFWLGGGLLLGFVSWVLMAEGDGWRGGWGVREFFVVAVWIGRLFAGVRTARRW